MDHAETAGGTTPNPRWVRRKDARPHELVVAAMELFVEKGFTATRLDDVAQRAGVSKGTLYRYFDSKEALFKAVVESGIIPALEEAEVQLQEFSGPTGDLLRWVFHGWWERILSQPTGGIPKLMLAEARNFPALAEYYRGAVIQRGTQLIRAVIQRGVAHGEFQLGALDPDRVVSLLMAPMIMLAVSRHSVNFCGSDIADPVAYIDTHLALSLRALTHKTEALR